MTHQEIKDLLPLYVVGGLDAESIAEVEYHLDSGCDTCPAEIREWNEITGLIALGGAADTPSPRVKERLLRRVQPEAAPRVVPLQRRRWRPAWAALPLAAAAAVLLMLGGQRYRELEQQVTTQAQQIAKLLSHVATQRTQAETVAALLKQEQGKLAGRDQEIQRLTTSLAEQQTASTGKSQQVLNLEAALAEQRQRVVVREQDLARIQARVAEAEKELEQERRRSKDRLEYAAAATAAQREAQRLQEELVQAREAVATHEREVREIRGQIDQQRTIVAASTRELEYLREAVSRQRGVIEVLTSPGVRIQYLRRSLPGVKSEGHVVWNDRKRAWVFYTFDMPQPPQDKEYQVWFMTELQGPVSAGLFTPDQSGTGQMVATPPSKLVGKISAVAVTLEPRGGLTKPSGEVYLRASL